ncbi:hypothetical protein ACFX2A_003889 [Malus domestica]
MGGHPQLGRARSHNGSECTALMEDGVVDTGSSRSKPKWSLSKGGKGDNKLADKIRCQRKEEEDARRAREIAYDAGSIGLGDMVAAGVEQVVLLKILEELNGEIMVNVSAGISQSFDLNSLPITVDSSASGIMGRGEKEGGQILKNGMVVGGRATDDDPFELAPIIEAVMNENKGRKRGAQEVECSEPGGNEPKANRPRKCLFREVGETTLEGSPKYQ